MDYGRLIRSTDAQGSGRGGWPEGAFLYLPSNPQTTPKRDLDEVAQEILGSIEPNDLTTHQRCGLEYKLHPDGSRSQNEREYIYVTE